MLNVYLTDLALYNQGRLYGKWITLPMDDDELAKNIAGVLKSGESIGYFELGVYEPHEEYFITDFEWDDVSLFDVDEYENISKLNEQLQLIQDASANQLRAMKFLLDESIAKDLEDAYYKADDVTIHKDSSMSDVAYDFINECYDLSKLPALITNNIDYESIAQELELDGCFTTVGSDVYEYQS